MKNPQIWVLSEVKVSYRSQTLMAHKPKISSSKDAEVVLRENWSDDIELLEECNVLFLTKANQVKGIYRASRGGTSGTVVDLKIIFAAALKGMAAAIIVAHNHPSGNLEPSRADIELTKKLRDAGLMLDLPTLDHLILAPFEGYYSFADNSMI
jgi:DNA repair protein RadC